MEQEVVSVPNVDIREFDLISFYDRNSLNSGHDDETIYSSNDSYSGDEYANMENTAYNIAAHATSNSNSIPNSNVAIKDSTGITVGNTNTTFFTGPVVNKTFITGPVVMQQIFADENLRKNESENLTGHQSKFWPWWKNVRFNRILILKKFKRSSLITITSVITVIAAIIITTAIVKLLTQQNGGV